jgi:hypothetical protein
MVLSLLVVMTMPNLVLMIIPIPILIAIAITVLQRLLILYSSPVSSLVRDLPLYIIQVIQQVYPLIGYCGGIRCMCRRIARSSGQ